MKGSLVTTQFSQSKLFLIAKIQIFTRYFNLVSFLIHKLFVELFGRKDLLINHVSCCLLLAYSDKDRYGLFRPVKSSPEDTNIEEEWKTMRNIHMDMNPWDFIEREDSSSR